MGEELLLPVRISVSKDVPAVVPSVIQSSLPLVPSVALNKI
jgi:hypothetical protein